MNSDGYTKLCDHSRLTRLDQNFVRCLNCGQSMINQQTIPKNKTRYDFTKENKSFDRNFDRNFNNIIEEIDKQNEPVYEYYTDRNWANMIKINRTVQYQSFPPKYKINVNGEDAILTDSQVKELLNDVKAIRIDEEQFKMKFGE